jgi:hypothetical protein
MELFSESLYAYIVYIENDQRQENCGEARVERVSRIYISDGYDISGRLLDARARLSLVNLITTA